MNEKLQNDIELYYTVRVPIRRRGRDLVPAKYFVPLVVVFFVLKDHGQPKPASIALMIVAFGIWMALSRMARSIGPLRLKKNGDFSIPFASNGQAIFTQKTSVVHVGDAPYSTTAFLDADFKVIATLRPYDFQNPMLIREWIEHHYGSLSRISNSSQWDWKNEQKKYGQLKLGSRGFYPLLIALVSIVAIALIYIIRSQSTV
jgi:hypothetical protein